MHTKSVAAACIVVVSVMLAPTSLPKADEVYDKINEVMKTKGDRHINRLGALIGARAYCRLDYKPLTQSWGNRYGMNSKTPQVTWDQMIDTAKSTLTDLQKADPGCSEAAKTSLMARAE